MAATHDVYRHNECLGSWQVVGDTCDPADYARKLAYGSTLDHLRSFVAYVAIDRVTKEKTEIGRGLAG